MSMCTDRNRAQSCPSHGWYQSASGSGADVSGAPNVLRS
jgi:hypothetical protein